MQLNLLEARSTYATVRNLIELSTLNLRQTHNNTTTNQQMHRNRQYPSPVQILGLHYEHADITITDERFMEVLFNNIQLEIISHHRYYKNTETYSTKNLKKNYKK